MHWPNEFTIPTHAFMALVALVLGAAQLRAPKGTSSHRLIGYLWIVLMVGIAISGAGIHEIRTWGLFSPIHLLIPVVLVSLWFSVQAARRGDVSRHGRIMKSLFFLALVSAGLFALLPGRALYHLMFH